ncbi:proteasome assembly chaperone family protein [Candidatus Woesearchaeota archaeon]|nr:proteasome assembly chaperone family protein [Candidatus Woesearchaeota archaeon]
MELSQKPKNVTVLTGFPGFGLVGTVATGFLIDHLKCERIGNHWFEELPATVALHDGKIVDPVGIYYSKKYNIVIVHSIANVAGVEWLASEVIQNICKELGAKELIAIEGVGSQRQDMQRAFYFTTDDKNAKALTKIGVEAMKEGIIVGVTSSLLLKTKVPLTCLFSETHTNLPDSKSAAKIVEVLDKYLGLDVDYRPLLKQAEEFEGKIKELLAKQAKATEDTETKKNLNYIT